MTQPAELVPGVGVVDWGTYLPFWRLERASIGATLGNPVGRGTRSVASYDEDSTTMAVEAARRLLVTSTSDPRVLVHATSAPAYLDKSNASAVHAALGLASDVPAYDVSSATRSAAAALDAGLAWGGAGRPALVAMADMRTGLPGSLDEAQGGDAAAALLLGTNQVAAEVVAHAHVTTEVLDRWKESTREPVRRWEERFGEHVYVPLGEAVVTEALKQAGLTAGDLQHVILTGVHERAARAVSRSIGCGAESVADDLSQVIGNTGACHGSLLLCDTLENATPGQLILMVSLADGADAVILRTTERLTAVQETHRAMGVPTVRDAIAAGRADLRYATFLTWREMLTREPPRRPDPEAPAAPPSRRAVDWKFGFIASRCDECGTRHLPPARRCMSCGAIDRMGSERMAPIPASVATFTVDRLAYSPSPPVVAAVVDFDGGGRFACELTDLDPAEVHIGMKVEMTFRKLSTTKGVHNYFWKAKPLRPQPRQGGN
jgi:3-hydroxy-3-methylglutaryl CoA synthase/uncharacterized OB-fold protein